MKITKLLKMTRSHILRVILCSIATMSILIIVGILNRVYLYVFVSWQIDIIQYNIDSNIPFEYILIILIWNYVIGVVIIGLLWKFIGIPRVTFLGKYYKHFIDMYSC